MRCMDESTPLTTRKWEEKTQRFDINTYFSVRCASYEHILVPLFTHFNIAFFNMYYMYRINRYCFINHLFKFRSGT